MARGKNSNRSPCPPTTGVGHPITHLQPESTWLGDATDGSSGERQGLPGRSSLRIPNFHTERLAPFERAKISGFDPNMARHSQLSYDAEVSKTIDWDSNKGRRVAFLMLKNADLGVIQKNYPESYWHAALMLERLNFQQHVYKVKCSFTPIEMVRMSFNYGPEFASMWKKAWEASRLEWLGVETWQTADPNSFQAAIDWSDGPNGVYNHRHFIFWKEECDDYTWSLRKPQECDQETLDELRYHASRLSKKFLKPEDFGDEIDILLETLPVSSSCFLEKKGKNKKEWESEFYDLYSCREEPNLRGLHSVAPKRPGETRDITIPSPGVLRACKRLNRPLKQALKRVPGCCFGSNREGCLEIMEDHNLLDNHYMRDFRKIGLTLPKAVIEAFLEGFFDKYPEFSRKAVEFFCNTELLVDLGTHREWFKSTSGFHMGFFNEGLTWIQYAVHNLVSSKMTKKGKLIKFTAFNDDSLISCDSKSRLGLYANRDQDVWDKLSCPLSYNKCGISENSFLFLEECFLHKEIVAKDVYFTIGIIGAKFAINIAHAKEYVNSITQSLGDLTVQVHLALEWVIQHWGIEFYPGEDQKPFLFGGWLTPKEEGLDISLRYYTGTKFENSAYRAVTSKKFEPKSLKQSKGWTFAARLLDFSLWGDIPSQLDTISGASLHFLDEASAKKQFSRISMDPKALFRFYHRFLKKREAIFLSKENLPVIDGWFSRHPNSVITSHTVGDHTMNISYMIDDAISMKAGKPQRLVYQTLLNEGTIRSSVSHVTKMPPEIHEILLKGYVFDIPRVMLPEGKYVHEAILYGQVDAYKEYCNRTGEVPIPRGATIMTEVLVFAAEHQIPWQIVHMYAKRGQMEDSMCFSKAPPAPERTPKRDRSEESLPPSPKKINTGRSTIEDNPLYNMIVETFPDWVPSFPLDDGPSLLVEEWGTTFLGSQEAVVAFLEDLEESLPPQASVNLDEFTSAVAEVHSDSTVDGGDFLNEMFGEE